MNTKTQAVQVVLSGKTYTIDKMNAVQAFKMAARLTEQLAPVIADAMGIFNTHDPSKMDSTKIAQDVVGLFPKLDMDKATDLIIDLCETARFADGDMAGQYITFDAAFDDDLENALLLAVEVSKLNFEKYIKKMQSQGTATTQQDDNTN